MNLKILNNDHEHCYWFNDDKYMYLVSYKACKQFLASTSEMARVQSAIEVIDIKSSRIIKHRFATFSEPKPDHVPAMASPPQSATHAELAKRLGVKK